MLTTNGLLVINQYLTNSISSWAGSIGIGALSSSATASNTKYMQYEFIRVPVTFKSYRTVSGSNQIVLKASVDPESVFKAYEIGVFPMTVNLNSYIDNYQITNFSEKYSSSTIWYSIANAGPAAWITTSASESRPRVSNTVVGISAGDTLYFPGTNATSSVSNYLLSIPTQQYNSYDSVQVLFSTASTMSGAGKLTITFADDSTTSTNYWTGSGTIPVTSTGSFATASLSLGIKPAAFTDNVTSASINFTGTGTLLLDAVKFVTGDYKTNDYQLVSRTISTDPNVPLFTKSYGQSMDIEYYIWVT